MQLGPETGGERPLHDLRVDAKVGGDAPANNSLDGGQSHFVLS